MTLEDAAPAVASARFPEWLPPDVAAMANRCWNAPIADRALVLRLATDDRMRGVWRELAKRKPVRPGGGSRGLFFVFAFAYAGMPTMAIPLAELTALQKACEQQAALLRTAADWLRKADEIAAVLDISFVFTWEKPQSAEPPYPLAGGDCVPGVLEAAAYFDAIAPAIARLCAAGHPLVVDRGQGSLGPRGYTRLLALKGKGDVRLAALRHAGDHRQRGAFADGADYGQASYILVLYQQGRLETRLSVY
jgi:hypothetical protein